MPNSINFRTRTPNPSVEEETHARALRFLSLTIFLLMADPLMNLYIGPAPLYAIDILAFLTWIYASRIPSSRRYPLQGFVVFILIAMLASELIAGIQLGTLLQPAYLIARTLLAISLFFATTRVIQSRSDLETLIKAGMLGALITAALMVTSSLPQTQGIIARRIFRFSFLMPSAEDVAAEYGSAGMAMRGQSLVGVSILSAAFLNTIWPLLFLLRTDEKGGARWNVPKILAIVLIPLGVILSYSRGAIAGLVMIVLIVLLLSSGRVRAPVVIGVGIAVLVISWAGWGSEYFKFEWLQQKSEYQFTYASQSNDMIQRIDAYSDPFQLVQEKPLFLLLGQGFAREKIPGATSEGGANHAVFAIATYGYGMLAAFAYVGLLLAAFRITWSHAWGAKDAFLIIFSRALLASLFGFSSWFILGLAAVSEPRGAMLLFFLFGLVAAQSNFAGSPEPVLQKQSLLSHRKFGERPVSYNKPSDFKP
jgi:hypothetical protein